MNLFQRTMILLLAAQTCLFADTMRVIVVCSNGHRVADRAILVTDSQDNAVPDATQTDDEGIFEIENAENYSLPFKLYVPVSEETDCGPFYVINTSWTSGRVIINYYPIGDPCSCSAFEPSNRLP